MDEHDVAEELLGDYPPPQKQILFDLLHGREHMVHRGKSLDALVGMELVDPDTMLLTLAGKAECVLIGFAEVVPA